LPVHRFSWVSFAKKSARNSKLENFEVHFSIVVVSFLNEFAALSFGGIDRFPSLGLLWMNQQETHSKVDRRKDTLEFFLAVCCLLHFAN